MQSTSSTVEPTHVSDNSVTAVTGAITTRRDGEEVIVRDEESILIGTGTHNTADDFFHRWLLVATGNMATTDTAYFDLLGSSFDIWGQYLTNSLVVKKLANFGFYRGGAEVMITVTAPSNAYGLYLVQAIPDRDVVNTLCVNGSSADTVYSATQGVHAFIDITTSNSVVLKLPWLSATLCGALPVTLGASVVWRLCLWCLQPIANAVNADTITATYNIYERMADDFNIMVPTFQSGKAGSGMAEKLKRGLATARKLKEDKTISKGASKIAAMASMAATVPFLAPFAAPVAAGAAALAGIAASFGFTREAAPEMPIDVHERSFAPLMNIDGKDGSEMVSLLQNNTVTIDATIGGGSAEDESAFGSLFKRWTIINTFVWDTATAAGTTIQTIPVTPFYSANLLGAIYPTVGGFIGYPFNYWKGGMEYKIVIPSSVYHRGMLQVYWSPIAITAGTTDVTQLLLNEIFDVEAGSEYTFTIDWGVSKMALLNSGFLTSTTSTWTGADTNGFLYFRVVSQLQAVGGSAPITCVLMARSMDDMRFWMPRVTGTLLNNTGTATYFEQIAIFQGGNLGDDAGDEGENFSLVPNITTDGTRTADVCFGEEIVSLRAMSQKFAVVDAGNFGGMAINSQQFYQLPYPQPPPGNYSTTVYPGYSTFVPWTWIGYYGAAFMGVRGSMRAKVLAIGPGATFFAQATNALLSDIVALRTGFLLNAGCGGSSAEQQLGNGGAEFTFPYYNPRKWLSACSPQSSAISTGGTPLTPQKIIAVCNNLGTAVNVNVKVYTAGGPDTTFIRFRRIPSFVSHP